MFSQLRVSGWRQYRTVDIAFHDRLTILTGANGAGKTTLLNLLNRHFGWNAPLISTPRMDKLGALRYLPDAWKPGALMNWVARVNELLEDAGVGGIDPIEDEPAPHLGPERSIGLIGYTSGAQAELRVPVQVGSTYGVNIPNQQPVDGLYIPSHRPLYGYQPVQSIPTVPKARAQMFSEYMDIIRQRFHGGHHPRTPNYFIKETLIALATFGHGNVVVEPNQEALATFDEFQQVLCLVLPPTLGFEKLAVRLPEVILITRSGEFSIDAVSGGVASIIDIAWQVFMYGSRERRFVVTIDEPENHLHPELQRTFLASLLAAFPHVQFVIASHNPFIVGSVPESSVYVLQYGPDKRVFSSYLDTANRAGTANEILRDVLGLSVTIPLWVERRLEHVTERFAGVGMTAESLAELRAELERAGMAAYVPEAIAEVARRTRAE